MYLFLAGFVLSQNHISVWFKTFIIWAKDISAWLLNMTGLLFVRNILRFRNIEGYSEILWSEVHISPHVLIYLFIYLFIFCIFRKNSPVLTSLQRKQSSFDKIGRSLHFLSSDAWTSENGEAYNNSYYHEYLANVKL